MCKCQPFALGVAIGATWALGVGLLGLLAMFGWGTAFVDLFGSVYIGYAASIPGIIIGFIWALIDGFVAGALVGWIYNRVASAESCCHEE